MRDHGGGNFPGFLEIRIEAGDVTVDRHFWDGNAWEMRTLHHAKGFWE